MPRAPDLHSHVAGAAWLRRAGFDLLTLAPIPLHRYNNARSDAAAPLLTPGGSMAADGVRHWCLVIGNSRALWSPFVDAFHSTHALQHAPNPLDLYTESSIHTALRNCQLPCAIYYSHRTYPDPPSHSHTNHTTLLSEPTTVPVNTTTTMKTHKYVGMQHVADSVGVAPFYPAIQFSLHARFGPWFSLRAIVVFETNGDDDNQRRYLDEFLGLDSDEFNRISSDREVEGAKVLIPENIKAQLSSLMSGKYEWKKWLAFRQELATLKQGWSEYEYSHNQAAYHYTHDKRYISK